MAVFILENYKPNNPRLEVTQIILNIFDSSSNKFFGTLSCTNGDYIPSIRKCIVSKTDLDFDDEMFEQLKITDTLYSYLYFRSKIVKTVLLLFYFLYYEHIFVHFYS